MNMHIGDPFFKRNSKEKGTMEPQVARGEVSIENDNYRHVEPVRWSIRFMEASQALNIIRKQTSKEDTHLKSKSTSSEDNLRYSIFKQPALY